jgi:type II secretory ATPase GspE/PulE/Tfp pilus assembly ATPase PilB-like protein
MPQDQQLVWPTPPHQCYADAQGPARTAARNAAIKKLIHRRATVDEMLATAITEGMRTLKQDGIEKILQGHTDVAQIRAVAA